MVEIRKRCARSNTVFDYTTVFKNKYIYLVGRIGVALLDSIVVVIVVVKVLLLLLLLQETTDTSDDQR